VTSDEHQGKPLTPAAEASQQTTVSGKVSAALAGSECRALRCAIEETCGTLQRDFPMLGQRSIAKATVKYVSSVLVPKGKIGAPRKEEIDRAERLRADSVSWRRVYIELGIHTAEGRNQIRATLRQRKRRALQKGVRNNAQVTNSLL
jgi:hypothetical protein